MTRLWHGTIALCLLSAVTVAARQDPVFRSLGDAVRVFVTVTDRSGRLVTGLTRENFEIRDEGRPQPITIFDNTPQPIQLIVMIDVSTSMYGNLPLLRTSAAQLFDRLGPDDLARVGTFGREVVISPTFTRDGQELRSALPTQIEDDSPTPLWRALDDAMEAFGDDDLRRVVLVLSDGGDSGPTGFRQRIVSQVEVIDRARDENVTIYAIGMQSRFPPDMRRQTGIGPGALQAMLTADQPNPGLARAALESGGGYREIRPREDLGAAFAQIVDELHTQYLIGFAPPKLDGKVHKIEVRLDQRGLTARARRNYVAPKAE